MKRLQIRKDGGEVEETPATNEGAEQGGNQPEGMYPKDDEDQDQQFM